MRDESPVLDQTEDFSREVTMEEYARRTRSTPKVTLATNVTRKKETKKPTRFKAASTRSVAHDDAAFAEAWEDKHSMAGTVTSLDTVKVSNKSAQPQIKKKEKWTNKFKRMMGGSKGNDPMAFSDANIVDTPPVPLKKLTPELGNRKRITSSDSINGRTRSSPPKTADSAEDQDELPDDSIRGRLDGIDVINLGGAQMTSTSPHPEYPCQGTLDDFPNFSFVGKSLQLSPADIVSNMLWQYGGDRNPPEMVLDGFLPGGDDRWTVRIEQHRSGLTTTAKVDDGGSPLLPTQDLWNSLWGSDPAPVSLTNLDKYESSDDPVLLLAAECSVPIDVDEDTFIISTHQHLRAIHDIAVGPLSAGKFELALAIFTKLLKGLNMIENNGLAFLKGTTLHNIGVIHLWKGDYENALTSFQSAIDERVKHLPKNHGDTVVSLVRKGTALFALGRYDEAIAAFEVALPLMPRNHIVRAKVQNNLGTAYFQQMDYVAALKHFTVSLETQRNWLDASVRRETLVTDASVTLCNMGRVYMERSDNDLASQVYEEALLLQTTIFKQDSDVVLDTRTNVAIAKARAGHVENGLQILKSCLRSKKARYGQNHPSALETIGLMGYFYTKLQSFENAENCLSSVRNWQKESLRSDHPSSKKTQQMIDAFEASTGKNFAVWV
jgi:Tfp pilus assembly protein PilF